MTSVMTLNDLPTIDVDFYDREFVQDPYPTLEEIRNAGRIVRHEKLGSYLITGYRDCARAMGQGRLFASDHEQIGKLFGGPPFTGMEGKKHSDFRGIWARDFMRKQVLDYAGLIKEIVTGQTESVFEQLKAGEVVDVVPRITRTVPTRVIAELMAIPTDRVPEFIAWTDDMTGIMEGRDDPTPRGRKLIEVGVAATRQMNDFVATVIEDRRRKPGNDLVTKMVLTEVEMSEIERVAANTQMIFAGNETTSKLMGHCLVALALHPEQKAELRRDRSLIPQAIEEVHRWTSVKVWNMRFVKAEEAELAGVVLPQGAEVMALQGLGNRDPERWENPDVFDIHRAQQSHLGFGIGPHACLGMNLARLEIETVLNLFLDEVPDWEVSGVDYGLNAMIRGPVKMPVNLPTQR